MVSFSCLLVAAIKGRLISFLYNQSISMAGFIKISLTFRTECVIDIQNNSWEDIMNGKKEK